MTRNAAWSSIGWLALLACDVQSPPGASGGIDLDSGAPRDAGSEAALDAGDARPPRCPRGFSVFNSDYQSSSVSLLDVDGKVLSASFISSGSTSTGLSAPLSGDVVPPRQTASGDELVILDRYPASVITWVNLGTARVRAQLRVASDQETNPHDYAEISPTKAYVARFSANASDIAIVNPLIPVITGTIDMRPAMAGEDQRFLPAVDRGVLAGGYYYALLAGYSVDFLSSAESRLVAVDTTNDSIAQVLVLHGLHGCSGLALSPDEQHVTIACSGAWRGDSVPKLDASGLVRVALGPSLREIDRFEARGFGEGSVSFNVDYASPETLVFGTFGRLPANGQPGADDTLIELQLTSRESRVLLRSAGLAFSLGEVRCASDCGRCFVADAKRNVVHRYVVEQGRLTAAQSFQADDRSGLPPRYIGAY